MRNLERHKWWEDYDAADGRLIVIGHYWRRFMAEVSPAVAEIHPEGFNPTGADMFPSYAPEALVGAQKKVLPRRLPLSLALSLIDFPSHWLSRSLIFPLIGSLIDFPLTFLLLRP